MTTRAPIICPPDLREKFLEATKDQNFGYLNIGIDFNTDSFVLIDYASKEKTKEQTWSKMASAAVAKTHTYFVIKDPMKDSIFLFVHWAPDSSTIKQRMLYASSRSTLKSFLGDTNFSPDFFCSTTEELSMEYLIKNRTMNKNIDFRSDAEIEADIADIESTATSASSQVMGNMPIEMKKSAKESIENFKNNACNCVLLSLNAEDQSIEGTEHKCSEILDVRELLKPAIPAYIMFLYSKGGSATHTKKVFAYYCPDRAERKLKFTYSTCKANLIKYCLEIKLEFFAKVELGSIDDVSVENLDYYIFPTVIKKETFAKPSAPKSLRKTRSHNRKKIDLGV